MKIIETKLKDCVIIEPRIFGDDRGWFMESYSGNKFSNNKLEYNFVQDNHSFSKEIGTLRGIHLQNFPYAQAKLVRCTRGKILDVAVDLREDSDTFKQWVAVELSADNFKQLLIPRGFGHAFLTLSENAEVQYKADNFYNYDSDRSIHYLDSEINIEWPQMEYILSEKDKNALELKETDVKFKEEN